MKWPGAGIKVHRGVLVEPIMQASWRHLIVEVAEPLFGISRRYKELMWISVVLLA
jgi:hypothetical protein